MFEPVKKVLKPRIEQVNETCNAINAANTAANWTDTTKPALLMVPTVSGIHRERFGEDSQYVYVHRPSTIDVLVRIVMGWAVKLNTTPSLPNSGGLLRTVLGFRRSGKSFLLATLVAMIRKQTPKFRVLYIHHCESWRSRPLENLKLEVLAAFHGELQIQKQIDTLSTMPDILQFVIDYKVVVVADQVDSLYEKIHSDLDGVARPAVQLLLHLKALSRNTLVIQAASSRKTKAFAECLSDLGNQQSIVPLNHGFSMEEFNVFRQYCAPYSGFTEDDFDTIEDLTGFFPGLLTLPGGDFKLLQQQSDSETIMTASVAFQQLVVAFDASVSTSLAYASTDKHMSYLAALTESQFTGDRTQIDFDLVSLPNASSMVFCPSRYISRRVSSFLLLKEQSHIGTLLASLEQKIKDSTQEPKKLGDAAEDYLMAYMKQKKRAPMPPLNPQLSTHHIILKHVREFSLLSPQPYVLSIDYKEQSLTTQHYSAVGYFPDGKFLRYIDFVVRVFVPGANGKHVMHIIVGQISLSTPVQHKQPHVELL